YRRTNLALAGRIPVPANVRTFMADSDSDKRGKAIDQLLDSAACTNHLTTVWRGWILPEALTNDQIASAAPQFEAWFRKRLRDNVGFDKIVTELLSAPFAGQMSRGRVDDDAESANGPQVFFVAKEGKPENLAAATSRVFLGIQLECAQCHDHPFGKWS